MSERDDSPYVLARWRDVSGETARLLRQNEALMERRLALCRRRADLFREILTVTRAFVEEVASSRVAAKEEDQPAGTSTGTVESSLLRR